MKTFSNLILTVALFTQLGTAQAPQSTPLNYQQLAMHWYTDGIQQGNGQLIVSMLSDDIDWWCFGPAGFTMNGYYKGKTGDNPVMNFFQRLNTELTKDTPDNFHLRKVDVTNNVVTVYGLETGAITEFIRNNNPKLQGDTFYNYFNHRLEFNDKGLISKFRCNWSLSDAQLSVEPF